MILEQNNMPSLNSFFREFMMDIDGRSALYKAVKLLSIKLNEQLKKQKITAPVLSLMLS